MRNVVVIGGGIAGLSAAYGLRGKSPGLPVRCTLVEAEPRLGGKVLSERRKGFLLEGGPDSFIPQKPQALELVRELGLGDRLLPSQDGRRGMFIYEGGRLLPVPEGLPMLAPGGWSELLRSPLLSWRGKLSFALEGWKPPRRDAGDESVASFVRRRLGNEVLERVAEPLLAHIHVGDVERMSLRATYPRLAGIETRFGSLRRGIAAMGSAAGPGSTGPLFWSLQGGLGGLIETLAGACDAELVQGRRVVSLRRSSTEDGYRLRLDDGTELDAAAVILAVPSYAAAGIVQELDEGLAERLRAIDYVSMATLSLGYRRQDIRLPPRGFGFFVPSREVDAVLACSWTSRKFEDQAPSGTALIRVFLGGALNERILTLDDEDLVAVVEKDLQRILGFRADPILRRLFRWPRGYPQYVVGHHDRVREIEAALPPGLVLAGSGFHGVGLPDCIRSGKAAAERVRELLKTCGGEPGSPPPGPGDG